MKGNVVSPLWNLEALMWTQLYLGSFGLHFRPRVGNSWTILSLLPQPEELLLKSADSEYGGDAGTCLYRKFLQTELRWWILSVPVLLRVVLLSKYADMQEWCHWVRQLIPTMLPSICFPGCCSDKEHKVILNSQAAWPQSNARTAQCTYYHTTWGQKVAATPAKAPTASFAKNFSL